MKTSAKFWSVVMVLIVVVMAFSGCAEMAYPYYDRDDSYGRSYGRQVVQPYYGYGGYSGGNYGYGGYGYGRGHHHDDDD